MLSVKNIFVAGYFSQAIGFHFNGLEILDIVHSQAQGATLVLVQEQLKQWPTKGPEVVKQVRQVENALEKMGFLPPEPPRSLEEYEHWTQSIVLQIENKLALQENLSAQEKLALFPFKWMHTFAISLGDTVHTLNLLFLVDDLLHAGENIPFLQQQAAHLLQMLQTRKEQLQKITERTDFLQVFAKPLQKKMQDLNQFLASIPVEPQLQSAFHDSKWITETEQLVSALIDTMSSLWSE